MRGVIAIGCLLIAHVAVSAADPGQNEQAAAARSPPGPYGQYRPYRPYHPYEEAHPDQENERAAAAGYRPYRPYGEEAHPDQERENEQEVQSQAPYGYGVKHRGYRVKKVCHTVCKRVEIHHRRVYYGQFAQVMAAAIQREVEIEEACKTNPSAVKVEDIDLHDNEEAEEEGAYRRPLKALHHKSKVCMRVCHRVGVRYGGYRVKKGYPPVCRPYLEDKE